MSRNYSPSPRETAETVALLCAILMAFATLALFSAGCASTCPPCNPDTDTVKIPAPYPVAVCDGVEVPPKPTPPAPLPPDATARQRAARVHRWLVALRGWAEEVATIAEHCTGPVPAIGGTP